MRVITYQIRLLEPALVTALEGDPNSAVAFRYLPGSVLRGTILAYYTRRFGEIANLADSPEAQHLFFDGTTRYLNGHPLAEDQSRQVHRALPTPLSWHVEKAKETPISDFALHAPMPGSHQQWQRVEQPFCCLLERTEASEEEDEDGNRVPHEISYRDQMILVSPARHVALHTARERKSGRPRQEDGAVYRYQSLAAGQSFIAHILWGRETDTPEGQQAFVDFCALLGGDDKQGVESKLGGARSAGYGRVKFEMIEAQEQTQSLENWREAPRAPCDKLLITLLSDALLRDECGQLTVDPRVVKVALENALDLTRGAFGEPQSFFRGTIVGGFNRKWGLPLPQAWAVKMGSVFVFDAPQVADPSAWEQKLRELEWNGIGERRAEGFGRVAVNWQNEAKLDLRKPQEKTPRAIIFGDTASQEVAERMAKRMLRRQLDDLIISQGNRPKLQQMPKNSQIARLRNVIHRELMQSQPGLSGVVEYLSDVKARRTPRQQYERARVGEASLLNWLEAKLQLGNADAWSQWFGFNSDQIKSIGSVSPTLTEQLRTEYLLRYLEVVLARATKQARDEDGERERRDRQ